VRSIIPTTIEENVLDYNLFQSYKWEKEVGNMPHIIVIPILSPAQAADQ